MIYFGTPSTPSIRETMQTRTDFGMITTATQGNRLLDGVPWCADNECFVADKFDPDRFVAFLGSFDTEQRARCRFAVAPDVVGDAVATLERFPAWSETIRALGFPVALAGQDGMRPADVPWDLVDVLFIGGSTEWKLGLNALNLTSTAQSLGLWVHMGRVNSRRRLLLARRDRIDSTDGTFLVFAPDQNLPKLVGWLNEANNQMMIG